MGYARKKVTVDGKKYVWVKHSDSTYMTLEELKSSNTVASVSFKPDDEPPFRWRVESDRVEPDSPLGTALPGWVGEEDTLLQAVNRVYNFLPKREARKVEISGDIQIVLSEMQNFMDE